MGMSRGTAQGDEPRRFQLARAERLNLAERIVLLVIIGGAVLFDLVGLITSPEPNFVVIALSITTSLLFVLYIWAPVTATIALTVVVASSILVGNTLGALGAWAVAAALVLRLGTTPLVIAYFAVFLLSNAALMFGIGGIGVPPTTAALALIIATFAGAVGLALRFSYARGNRLEIELAEQAEREREAVQAERRWIAGELHDSIAPHLTVVAMHVQLLDDDTARSMSQDAIRVAARKALSDLRFVIQLAEDAPSGTGVPSGDLASAIEEATEEFEATGQTVVCEGDPHDESIPRGAEIILARIVRESATNIIKYSGPGEVRFGLASTPESVSLSIRSPLPTVARRDMPSTGTGLNRMAERVLGVSGEFRAGPIEDAWEVFVKLPVASVAAEEA